MSDDLLLWDLDSVQSHIDYWPRKVPAFDTFALDEAEAELWFDFSRACYALESWL